MSESDESWVKQQEGDGLLLLSKPGVCSISKDGPHFLDSEPELLGALMTSVPFSLHPLQLLVFAQRKECTSRK